VKIRTDKATPWATRGRKATGLIVGRRESRVAADAAARFFCLSRKKDSKRFRTRLRSFRYRCRIRTVTATARWDIGTVRVGYFESRSVNVDGRFGAMGMLDGSATEIDSGAEAFAGIKQPTAA
jgi:hypothetical protein